MHPFPGQCGRRTSSGGARCAFSRVISGKQLDGSLKDTEAGDGSSLGGQLLAGLLLQVEPLTVHGVELDLEGRHVDGRSDVGGRGWLVPPGAGFGEAGRAAGGRVGGDLQQRSGGVVGWPAAAADGEIKRGDQVGGCPPGERQSSGAASLVDLADVVDPARVVVDTAVTQQLRWERGHPMELWQFDVMGGIGLVDGTEVKAVTGIDDHSRFCVAVGLVARASSRPVCSVFARALDRYGVPAQVLTDNGKVFTGKYAHRPIEVLFDRNLPGERHRAPADQGPLPDHDRKESGSVREGEVRDEPEANATGPARGAGDGQGATLLCDVAHQGVTVARPSA